MAKRLLTWISMAWAIGPGLALAGPPTFNKDVAPILLKNCAGCHRPGEVGPFSLLTFQDAAKRADFLAEITASRRMPPWKAEPGFGEFHDERRLTEKEIQTIAAWSEAGAPEGDARDLPPTPKFPEGWQLGTPDLVLQVPQAFSVPSSGPDVYRCFVLPIPIDSNKTVAAVEFRPGNRKVVHHAILYLDNAGAARQKDEKDPGPGYASFGGPGIRPTGALGGWAPGATPRMLPDGIGKFLREGSDLVLQLHYHPDGKPETDQSTVGIYFTKTPARTIVGGVALVNRDLQIPAGEKRYHVTARTDPLPVDAQAIGVSPHMHNLGREMKVVAETPDGKTIPLIWIKDWDFNWQGQYQYRSPVKLAKGTVLKVDAYYDNSLDNPRNPSNPPKPVHWGEQTTDEMCLVGVQMITNNNADLLKLLTMRGNGLGAALVGGDTGGDAKRPGAALLKGARAKAGAGAGAGLGAGLGAGAGFPIPEAFKDRLGRFDKNNDGKLSSEEVEAIPGPARDRIKDVIKQRMGGEKP